jgi:hypothetical protein
LNGPGWIRTNDLGIKSLVGTSAANCYHLKQPATTTNRSCTEVQRTAGCGDKLVLRFVLHRRCCELSRVAAAVAYAKSKKFTEPVALLSTQPADLPLPRTALRRSFNLLTLRARCDMVRRGSTVRVRQRACVKCLQTRISSRLSVQHVGYIAGTSLVRATPRGHVRRLKDTVHPKSYGACIDDVPACGLVRCLAGREPTPSLQRAGQPHKTVTPRVREKPGGFLSLHRGM